MEQDTNWPDAVEQPQTVSGSRHGRMVMCDATREGNEIAPKICGVRESISWNSDTICADCLHVIDECKDVPRNTHKNCDGFVVVTECEGFESVGT
jgi:hypothetical protein